MSLPEELKNEILASIVVYPDFPTPGIQFQDIMPIFAKPALVDRICKQIANQVRGKIDVVAALEARGFLFGPQVAINLGVPFVPIRKKGKLPGPTISAKYVKEYGVDIVELQAGALKSGQRVLLLDDLLATGGTLGGAIELVKKSGTSVAEIVVIIELTGLNGRATISKNISLHALLTF